MLRAVIVGAPGSGKGTISGKIVEKFRVKHVSSGDLLRSHMRSSPQFQSIMKEGKLIADDVIEQMVFPELRSSNHGWLLDGFPRTVVQAKSLLANHHVDKVINLNVPDRTIIERLAGRWVHMKSGRTYHTTFNPPTVEGVDNITGEALEQREDDNPAVVQQRLSLYHTQTGPVLDYFHSLGLLRSYSGTESKTIWPHIQKDIELFLNNRL